ncbi:hypothetical protein [Streptomyces sp. NPDC001135]
MSIARRCAVMVGTAALAIGTLTTGVNTASAADQWTYKLVEDPGKSFGVAVYNNGKYAGMAYWHADATAGGPGDAVSASDALADGYGITAYAYTPWGTRSATTAGHSAPYTSPYTTGNLPEGTYINLQACVVKGGIVDCSMEYQGQA